MQNAVILACSWVTQPTYLRVAACLLTLSLSSCAAQPSTDRPEKLDAGLIKVNVCNSSSSGTQVVTAYALEKGIFATHGLDVTLVTINSGSRAIAALISGSVQLCQMAGSAVAHAVVAGGDVAIIGALFNGYVYSLMVSADIRSPADLKGKAVAVSAFGSASETAMRLAIRTLGLQPDRDVAILAIGGQPERLAALEAGYVVGTLLSFPETILARQKGLRVLLDLSTLDLPTLHTGVATSKDFLTGNRSTVLNFMKAITEAISLIKRDKEGAIAAISRAMQLDRQKDAAVLEETYDVLYKHKLVDIPVPSLAGISALLAEIALENPAAARFTPEAVADLSVVRELEAGGFFAGLSRRK